MTFEQIQQLIELVNNLEISEFKLEHEGFKVNIRTKHYSKVIQQTALPSSMVMPVQQAPPPPPPVEAVSTTQESPPPSNEQTASSPTPAATSTEKTIKSPMIGTFYRCSGPDKPPYVKIGDTIQKGDVVCIIEAMKLFNEIEADMSGRIIEILADDNSPVEYDQPLFVIEPA